MDNVLPFLPQDFDDRYFQAAPQDQWLDKLSPGTIFGCVNMNESGRFKVIVPMFGVPIRFMYDDHTEHKVVNPDTLNLIPHEGKIVLVGRAAVTLPRKFVRLQQVQVGSTPKELAVKPHYAGLGEAVAALSKLRGRRR